MTDEPCLAQRFSALFVGHPFVHGEFIPEGNGVPTGGKIKGKIKTVPRAATLSDWKRHLATGGFGIGITPARLSGTIWFAAIDIDDYELDLPRLNKRIRELGLPLVLCRTKSGGGHAYLFGKEELPASLVRSTLKEWARALGVSQTPDRNGRLRDVEIFPKQDRLEKESDSGNWINLPYSGGDLSTRYAFGDDDGAIGVEAFLIRAAEYAVTLDQLRSITVPIVPEPQMPPPATPAINAAVKDLPTIRRTAKQNEGRNGYLFSFVCQQRALGRSEESTLEMAITLRDSAGEREHPNFANRTDMPTDEEIGSMVKRAFRKYAVSGSVEAITAMNERYFVAKHGGKTIVAEEICERQNGSTRTRWKLEFSTFADIKNYYVQQIEVGRDGKGKPITVPLGALWLYSEERRTYERIIFDPSLPIGDRGRDFNLWRGFAVEAAAGIWSLFREHIRKIICQDNKEYFEYVLRWMAKCVQCPGDQGQVAIVIQGRQGIGKGLFVRIFGEGVFGQHYLHIANSRHLLGHFNFHLLDAVFVVADEALWAGDKEGESVLKTLITERDLWIEKKHHTPVRAVNHVHLMILSNKEWVVPTELDDRRFFVLNASDEQKGNSQYFRAIHDQMENGGIEAMLFDLLAMDLSDFNVEDRPQTSAHFAQKVHSMTQEQAWWFGILEDGLLPGDSAENGWSGVVAREWLQDHYATKCAQAGRTRKSFVTQLGMQLATLTGQKPGHRQILVPKRGDSEGHHWVPAYVLPPLAECRRHLETLAMIPGYPWPEPPDQEIGRQERELFDREAE